MRQTQCFVCFDSNVSSSFVLSACRVLLASPPPPPTTVAKRMYHQRWQQCIWKGGGRGEGSAIGAQRIGNNATSKGKKKSQVYFIQMILRLNRSLPSFQYIVKLHKYPCKLVYFIYKIYHLQLDSPGSAGVEGVKNVSYLAKGSGS